MVIKNKTVKKPHYVLIIEDNSHHAELITELLDRHFSPIVVHTVDNLSDGLAFVSKSAYDLIITAGVITGIPITKYLEKLSSRASSTPIVVISGQGDEKLAAKIIKLGATEYYPKTKETLDELPKHLQRHLAGKKNRANKTKSLPPNTKQDNAIPPTAAEIIREVERITQQTLSLTDTRRRRKMRSAEESEKLERLLSQIKNLRDLALKLAK